MTAATVDRIVQKISALPRLPMTSMRLMQLLSNPDSSVRDVVEVIRFDPVVTAELLKICNSASIGLMRKIESVTDAARLLGTNRIFQLVMAAHTRTMLGSSQDGYGIPAGALWKHSVAVALAVERLARSLAREQVGQAFTAGLLHDIGKIILNTSVGADYAKIAELVKQGGVSFCEAEKSILGFTHAEIGARVGERWELPEAIVRAIRYHHEPEFCEPHDAIVDLTHIADIVCLQIGVGGGDDAMYYRIDGAAMERQGLKLSTLETVGAEVIVELKSIEKAFH
ncbi:MAG: HDOD domain-containing protein [Phycisphaerales bacterium]|nr:HDOD domain-containing protein [Phycisphaerales bacterium]